MILEQLAEQCQIEAGLAAKPIDKPWKGSPFHLGPNKYTPLQKALEFKSSAAMYMLMNGCIGWAAARFRGHCDTALLEDLAQALFCFQVSPHYVEMVRSFKRVPKTTGFELCEGATQVYAWIFFSKQIPRGHAWPLYPPFNIAAQAVYLTKHVMPKGYKPFEKWIEAEIAKLDKVAGFPDALTEPLSPDISPEVRHAETVRAMGAPLGLSVLDPQAEFDPAANAAEIDTMLASFDWEKNQFLRPPADMMASGFQGTPYRYAP